MALKDELSLAELAKTVVAEDPVLRDMLRQLVADMVGVMRYTMRHGTPSEKLQLARSIVPQLLTAMKSVDQNQTDAAKREAYERMMAKMRGEESVSPLPTAAQDHAPV